MKTDGTGVTTATTLRKKANCFNLPHQMELLERAGISTEESVAQLEAGQSYFPKQNWLDLIAYASVNCHARLLKKQQRW